MGMQWKNALKNFVGSEMVLICISTFSSFPFVAAKKIIFAYANKLTFFYIGPEREEFKHFKVIYTTVADEEDCRINATNLQRRCRAVQTAKSATSCTLQEDFFVFWLHADFWFYAT